MKLKTGDKVTIIAGANKGKTGKITKVLDEKVIVEGVNLVKKHLKPRNNGGTGEIIETEAPIHRSNVKKIEEKAAKKVAKKETKSKEK
jgi:large subunit ribosomal protein L24